MDVLADSSFRDTEAGRVIVEGSLWHEARRGTNAMGLVLHDRAPRSVWRGEHFFRSQGGVSCIAVPIFDSRGAVAGVLDASTGSEIWHPHSAALLNMSAANIESGLFHFEQDAHTILRVHARPEYLLTVSAGLVALDNDGAIVSISRRGREILGVPGLALPATLDALFEATSPTLAAQIAAGKPFSCRSRVNGTVFVSCSHDRRREMIAAVTPRAPVACAPPPPRPQSQTVPVYADPKLRHQLTALHSIVETRLPILIRGQSGTGKSTLARHIHRRAFPAGELVAVACGGVFDADSRQHALSTIERVLCRAHDDKTPRPGAGMTLFLEGVNELPLSAQGALLPVLDAWENAADPVRQATQIVSSMCDSTPSETDSLTLRQELQFRLAAFSVRLPPLCQRQDLKQVAAALIAEDAPGLVIDPEAITVLLSHPWPGHIRELRTTLRIAAALSDRSALRRDDVLAALRTSEASPPEVAATETAAGDMTPCHGCRQSALRRDRCITIRETFIALDHNVSRTAKSLGIARSTVYEHIGDLRRAPAELGEKPGS